MNILVKVLEVGEVVVEAAVEVVEVSVLTVKIVKATVARPMSPMQKTTAAHLLG